MSSGFGLLKEMLRAATPIAYLSSKGVQPEHFEELERPVFDFMKAHYENYGVFPQYETIVHDTRTDFPDGLPAESIDYWIDQVKNRYLATRIGEAAGQLRDHADHGRVSESHSVLQNLYTIVSNQCSMNKLEHVGENAMELLEDFDRKQRMVGVTGIPFGFPMLDETTDGAQPGDTIALSGMYGVGKSMVLFQFAINAHESGRRVLIISPEMLIKQCRRRVIALQEHLDMMALKLGKLCYWGRQKFADALARSHEQNIYFMEAGSRTTVPDIIQRIHEIQPDVIYMDSAYILNTVNRTQSRWEKVAQTADELKDVAKQFMIPVFSSYQLNAKGEVAHSGMAIKQVASIVFELRRDLDEERLWYDAGNRTDYPFRLLEVKKGREGESGTIELNFKMLSGTINQYRVITDEIGG